MSFPKMETINKDKKGKYKDIYFNRAKPSKKKMEGCSTSSTLLTGYKMHL